MADLPPWVTDLSPIKNIWGYEQARLNVGGCQTIDKFRQAEALGSNSIAQPEPVRLLATMPEGGEKCV